MPELAFTLGSSALILGGSPSASQAAADARPSGLGQRSSFCCRLHTLPLPSDQNCDYGGIISVAEKDDGFEILLNAFAMIAVAFFDI